MQENTDQNNSEYEHFLFSAYYTCIHDKKNVQREVGLSSGW